VKEKKGILRKTLEALDKKVGFELAYAHCDIPCGIYDPHAAQLAAHTVIRMDMLIADLVKANDMSPEGRNKMIRCVRVKEKHADACEDEIETLWADYFKPDHFKSFPELHQLVWDTVQLASKTKQGVNIEDAKALLANVEAVAEIFWKTKNVETKKIPSFYPSGETMVYPKV
jgi:nickel superoxide dismutase